MSRVDYQELSCEYDDQGAPILFQGEQRFTGVAFETNEAGAVITEDDYRNGYLSGYSKQWYPSGNVKKIEVFLDNAPHGIRQEWHENGVLKTNAVSEYGVLLHQETYDDHGKSLSVFNLSEHDSQFKWLQKVRQS